MLQLQTIDRIVIYNLSNSGNSDDPARPWEWTLEPVDDKISTLGQGLTLCVVWSIYDS